MFFSRPLLERNSMHGSISEEIIWFSRKYGIKISNAKSVEDASIWVMFIAKCSDTLVTSRCVRRSVMSANKFYRSVVSACGQNGTTGTSRCVRCSVMSAMDFHRSVVSACGQNGTTGTSRCVRRSVMSANKFYRSVVSACVYMHICRNFFQLTLCELIIIK